ncbi:MAG: WXG100 family type VII secretion target [Jatrophihabitans sp.]|uniref:WXG100 family type VII secretion target n=1 Tax=Jatrophihabitans sp. TaxID=1932789 RepID=UPI003F8193D5
MSEAFAVDLDGLADLVARMAAFDRAAEALGRRIDATVTGLATTWTGDAATSYEAAHARWRRDLDDLREAVTALHGVAHAAHHNYSAALAANRSMWAGL